MGLPVVVSLNNERLRFGWRDVIRNPLNQSVSQSVVLAAQQHAAQAHDLVSKSRPLHRVSAATSRAAMPTLASPSTGSASSPTRSTLRPRSATMAATGSCSLAASRPRRACTSCWQRGGCCPSCSSTSSVPVPNQPQPQLGVTYHGALPHADLLHLMSRARAVIVPSIWPEPSGRVVFEAMACGTPVIATTRWRACRRGDPRFTVIRKFDRSAAESGAPGRWLDTI